MKRNRSSRLTRAIHMYPPERGQDPAYLIPNLLHVAGTTLVRHPSTLDARWLAAHMAIQISKGGSMAPFRSARKSMTTLVTSLRKGHETSRLLRLLAYPARLRDDDEWLRLLYARDGRVIGDEPLVTPKDLRYPSLPFCEALVIDDVRLLLHRTSRGLQKTSMCDDLLRHFSHLNERGIAVIAFFPQELNESITPAAEAHLVNPIEIQLSCDPAGIRETASSVLVHRRKTSEVDPTLTFFRWYVVLPAIGEEKAEDGTKPLGDASTSLVSFDVPKETEGAQEQKEDRQARIERLAAQGFTGADIARKLSVHPSTVSRRLRGLFGG